MKDDNLHLPKKGFCPGGSELFHEIALDYWIEEDIIYHHAPEFATIFGLPQKMEYAQDYLIRSGAIQPESSKEFSEMFRRIQAGETHAECIVHARTASGKMLWLQLLLTAVTQPDGKPKRAVGVLRDVSEQRERELEQLNEPYQREIMMREALVYYEADLTEGKTLCGMDYIFRVMALEQTDDYAKAMNQLIDNLVYPADRDEVRMTLDIGSLRRNFEEGSRKIRLDYRRLTGEGLVIWVSGSIYLSRNPINRHVILYFYVKDISDQKIREIGPRVYSERDILTGLYNKVAAEEYIQDKIDRDCESGKMGAMLYICLEGLKEINDTLGRYFGDALLSELGHRLQAACQPQDIAVRSGVVFLAYLPELTDSQQAVARAVQIRLQMEECQQAMPRPCAFSVRIGIAETPEHGTTFGLLCRHAKQALCKGTGFDYAVARYGAHSLAEVPLRKSDTGAMEQNPDENIAEHIFRTLSGSKSPDTAICGVLNQVLEHYGFDCCYLYELRPEGTAECTFECGGSSTLTAPEKFRMMDREQVEQVKRNFGADGLQIIDGQDMQPENRYPKNLNLRFIYRLQHNGAFSGFISFDYCKPADREKLLRESDTLLSVAQILDMFHSSRTANKELWESNFLLQNIVDTMRSCTYIIDPTTHLLKYVNQNTRQEIFEAEAGKLCYEAIRGRKRPCEDCPIERMLRNGNSEDHCEMYLDRYGMWAQIHSTLMTVPSGQVFGVFSGFDFSEEPREKWIQEQNISAFTQDTSLYDALSLSTDDYIIMCDMSTRLFYFPQKMVEEFDLPAQIIKDGVSVWAQRVHPDDLNDFDRDINRMFNGQTDTHNQEYRARNKDGIWTWLRAKGHVERDKNGNPTLFAVVLTNLGRKNKIDQLTGIPDKYEFEVRTRALLAENPNRGVLLVLGLDNFRYINNLYGWEFGDSMLRETAQRIQNLLPESVQLYRLDGDKFGVFLPEADADAADCCYKRLFAAFHKHRQVGERRYFCTISGGCACFEGDIPAFSLLFKQASYALEYAKHEGKNRMTHYSEETMQSSDRGLKLMAKLHECVEANFTGFELYYQPQVNPATCGVCSAEALLRWRCPEIGMVSPADFIPLLEQSGLIHRVGLWVIQQALEAVRIWRRKIPDFTVSVNLSFVQLQDQSFLPYLQEQVNSGVLDARMLHLEITESCIADGSNSLKGVFEVMRGLGFRIEMDDFGTGYSSLEILKNAPADVVKIDRTFVRDITHSNFDATFIQFVVTLCHSVGIRVCLEGVETQEEFTLVSSMELDLIQGFFFGKPQPAREFTANYIDE